MFSDTQLTLGMTSYVTGHLLEAAVVVRRRSKDNGLDEERLVAMVFLVSPDNAETPAPGVISTQNNLMTAVEVAGVGGGMREREI